MPYLGVRPADITSATEAEIAGDLTVDTSTLKVDAANNRVAIGATSSVARLEIEDGGTSDSYLMKITADDQNPYAFMVGNDTYSSTDSNGFGFVQRNDGTAYIYNGGALRAAFHSVSGGVLSVEGGVVLGAGAANSTTANTLDDYEEGTFTPTFSSGLTSPGYLSQVGTYVKVGAMVICSVYLRANSGTENSDHIRIGGMPFAFTSATDHAYGGFFTYNGGFWSSDANTTWLGLSANTTLGFYLQSNGASIPGTNSNVAANLAAACRLTVVYRTDA